MLNVIVDYYMTNRHKDSETTKLKNTFHFYKCQTVNQ